VRVIAGELALIAENCNANGSVALPMTGGGEVEILGGVVGVASDELNRGEGEDDDKDDDDDDEIVKRDNRIELLRCLGAGAGFSLMVRRASWH
jgi:hypothetical protein